MYDFKNYLDFLSIKYSNSALLLNKYSFENANKIKNQNIHLIGSFIPPAVGSIVPLSKLLNDEIAAFKSKYKFIFSTNASNYVLDKHGKEIYMGSELVSFFFENKNYGLIFSDPTGNYYKFLTRLFDKLPKNIYFISLEHDFINVIKQSDALIRATIMDGDSISIKEALYYGKKVFATNVVDRPDGVTCFENFVQLKDLLEKFSPECDNITVENNFNAILALYKSQFDTF